MHFFWMHLEGYIKILFLTNSVVLLKEIRNPFQPRRIQPSKCAVCEFGQKERALRGHKESQRQRKRDEKNEKRSMCLKKCNMYLEMSLDARGEVQTHKVLSHAYETALSPSFMYFGKRKGQDFQKSFQIHVCFLPQRCRDDLKLTDGITFVKLVLKDLDNSTLGQCNCFYIQSF